MSALHRTRTAFVADLTRTRHMLAVSAVIMGATFIPLVGGPPEAHEFAALREALSGRTAAAPIALIEPAPQPRAEFRAVRAETSAKANEESDFTTLELSVAAEPNLSVPERDDLARLDESDVQELAAPVEDEMDPEVLEEEAAPAA